MRDPVVERSPSGVTDPLLMQMGRVVMAREWHEP